MDRVFDYFKILFLKIKTSLMDKDDNSTILWGERRLEGYMLNNGEVNYKAQLTPQEYLKKYHPGDWINKPIKFFPTNPSYNPNKLKYTYSDMGGIGHPSKERTQNELMFKGGNYFDYPSSVSYGFKSMWDETERDAERIKELMGISVDTIIPVQPMGPPSGMLFHLNMVYDDLSDSISEDKLLTYKTKLILNFKNELLPPTSGSTSVGYENKRIYPDFLRR